MSEITCPHCGYKPEINEYDYAEAPGRFFTLGIEAKAENNMEWFAKYDKREAVLGCPKCGIMFMNMGYSQND